MSTGSITTVSDMGARVNPPMDRAMEHQLRWKRVWQNPKLLPTPNKDSMAAKPYSKILEEHKSRSRGKWGELVGARAGCGIEAPHQGKTLPAKALIIPAMEIQQSLLAGSYWLSTYLFCLTSREVTHPRLQQWRDRQSPFLHLQMETSFPARNGSGSSTGLSKGQADGDQRLA